MAETPPIYFAHVILAALPASELDNLEPVAQDAMLQWNALGGVTPEKTWAALCMMYEAIKRTLGPAHRRVYWTCQAKALKMVPKPQEARKQLILPR